MSPERAELTLEEMLADPIVQLVMLRDRISADDVRRVMDEARRRWRAPPQTPPRGGWLQAAE